MAQVGTAAMITKGTRRSSILILTLIILGVLLRVAYISRPFDERSITGWHEFDYLQIARNFYRETMNILYPAIDWRGDTPGYVEMEFPLVPWIAALLYRLFGYNEALLRFLPVAFSIGGLLAFAWLSVRLLPPLGAIFAVSAFAINPILVILANSAQPESGMLFFVILAFSLLYRWDQEQRFSTLVAASFALACAILMKLPAAYLGFVFVYVVLRRLRWHSFKDPRIYAAAALALLPPVAWYSWAYGFWTQYGNSMGVSNEAHFIGWDLLMTPRFLIGNLWIEHHSVWTPAGVFLALAALWARPFRGEIIWVWYGAVMLFYLLAARTSGDPWAYYYHCSSVPPACLLMGSGIAALADGAVGPLRRWRRFGKYSRLVATLLGVAVIFWSIAMTGRNILRRDGFLLHSDYVEMRPMRACATDLAPYIPREALILVRGIFPADEHGKPVAINEPMMFAFLDRRGFNYPLLPWTPGQPSTHRPAQTFDSFIAHGARYWLVANGDLADDVVRQLAERFRLVATCSDGYALYDLSAGNDAAGPPLRR